MEQITGYVERITFQNPENGYTVAQLQRPHHNGLTCIIGSMPTLQPGATIRCFGTWKNHLIHGKQFVVSEFKTETPADVEGIRRYLGSGLIKGIGPSYAKRIVDVFGEHTLTIIDEDPQQLLQVEGLGKKRLELIIFCWESQKTIRDVMVFLQTYGVSPAFAQKIFKAYGPKSIQKVKENPYDLAKEVTGIGFLSADAIAQKLGVPFESPHRIDAGIEFVLYQLSGEGHVCYPVEEFIPLAMEKLRVTKEPVEERISVLKGEDRVEVFELQHGGVMKPFIWSKMLFAGETGIAREIKRIQRGQSNLRAVDAPKALSWVQEKLNIKLAPNQQKAVAQALSDKVEIITGGPGTGKSTITNAILTIMDKLTPNICLAAPTGRAAKRMTEITGRKAQTIHTLLEFDFKGGFKRKRDNPLDCDLIIVDEASMIDTMLMYHLLKAIPTHARVIFVGDINQLPSVGPGNVLKDMIASRSISVCMLNEIFRQAAGSRIITNAHKINNGQPPDIDNVPNSDFFFISALEPEEVLSEIVSLVTTRVPKKFGFNSIDQIQVLAPMRKGVIGTENLNEVLQKALNPKIESLFAHGRKFLLGDKVMQIRNDYKRGVFNGDIGIVSKINPQAQELVVTIDEREVIYEFSDLDELVLAYAVSIHKYQGSECPCVIIPVHTTHFKLLFRNLLYTGVTRGRKLVILVGSPKAIFIAVKNDEVRKRHTGLQHALASINMTELL